MIETVQVGKCACGRDLGRYTVEYSPTEDVPVCDVCYMHHRIESGCEECGGALTGGYYVQDDKLKCCGCYVFREPSGSMTNEAIQTLYEAARYCLEDDCQSSFDKKIVPWLAKLDHVALFALSAMFASEGAAELAKIIAAYGLAVWSPVTMPGARPDPVEFIARWQAEAEASANARRLIEPPPF